MRETTARFSVPPHLGHFVAPPCRLSNLSTKHSTHARQLAPNRSTAAALENNRTIWYPRVCLGEAQRGENVNAFRGRRKKGAERVSNRKSNGNRQLMESIKRDPSGTLSLAPNSELLIASWTVAGLMEPLSILYRIFS